jgi:hypothetical protein
VRAASATPAKSDIDAVYAIARQGLKKKEHAVNAAPSSSFMVSITKSRSQNDSDHLTRGGVVYR